jgi:outer membrane protein insertion porin family
MTRRITKILVLLYFLCSSLINCQTISKIQISGNKNFTENDYAGWIKIPVGSKIFAGIEDSVSSRITSALKEKSYLHPSFQKVELKKNDNFSFILNINLFEGNKTLINKINFSGALKDSAHVSSLILQLNGSPLTKSNLDFVFSQVLDYYENKGYPFASINIESIELADDSLNQNHSANLLLSVNEGIKSKIDKIEITGNEKTKDYVITRALQINIGEEYSQKKIDAVKEKINRLRFFDNVEAPSFYFNSKKEGVLKIAVKEKQTNNFDGILGYVPAANDKESGYLTGFVNISMKNLFGTGRSASLKWQQENRNSQELELKYLEPWIFNFPFNIELGLFQRKQDSTYVQRNIEGKLEFIATQEASASFIITSQSTIPSQLQNDVFTVYNSSSLSTGVNFKADTRDDFYSPTEGIYFSSTYSYASKTINGPASYITESTKTKATLQRLEFDFNIYKQFFTEQVIALGVHARELRGSDIEVSDLYFLGGTNSLRGYREKQFQGNRTIWTNLEYRLENKDR